MTSKRIESIRAEIRGFADPRKAMDLRWFFKTAPGEYGEGDVFLGVRVPVVRRLARKHKDLPLEDAGQLLCSAIHEERLLALCILLRQYEKSDGAGRGRIYRLYLKKVPHINNWDLVDCSAPQIVGQHLECRSRAPLYRLAKSRSLWKRRIAVMATFYYVRQGEYDDTLKIADMLLADQEGLIHKAVGWMLREVGNRSPEKEEAFLKERCRTMPRTMPRYAIERFPEDKRQKYLQGKV